MSRRTERVGEQLRADVAEALRREVSDPRVQLVTITRVDVAPDFSQALVFWSALDDRRDIEDVQAGLEAAASFLRGRLARKSTFKRMPRLVFRHDAALAQGDAMLALLGEMSDAEKA